MFTVIESENTKLLFIGDIHGEFRAIKNCIRQYGLKDCNIIFCGDFGIGFENINETKRKLKPTEKICSENNVNVFALRGNHDNPSYYNTDIDNLNYQKIKLLRDYTIIKTPNHNVLCVGGATSVDRINRIASYKHWIETLIIQKHYRKEVAEKKAKLYWWENEVFLYEPEIIDEIKKADINIDVVATHSAPSFCQPLTNPKSIYWSRLDNNLEEDLYKEREDFTKLYKHLLLNGNSLTYWFYGHYHMHNFEHIENTNFIGLDMGRQSLKSNNPGGVFDVSELR